MNEKEELEYHEPFIHFPHEELMEQLDISFNQLNASIQREIFVFNNKFDEFIVGSLTDEEHEELIKMSENIAKMIKKQISDVSGKVTGIFTGILLAVGAFFGIKKITEL